MRWIAALALAAALAARASAGPDAVQECRDAWAAFEAGTHELATAFGTRDQGAVAHAYEHIDAARRRLGAAFASAPWDAFDRDKDGSLLDMAYEAVANDARSRGDLATARKALASFVATCCSASAFAARGVALPELDLAAGDVDAAIEGFRAGARQTQAPHDLIESDREFTALLRGGDVLAACCNFDGARDRYAAARKLRESLDGKNPMVAAWSERVNAELAARDLVGTATPALPALTWIGDAPKDTPHMVTVVVAVPIGRRGDSGRLRALDRLSGEGVAVRVIVSGDRVGQPVRAIDGAAGRVAICIPKGPDDGDGELFASGAAPGVTDLAKRVREKLALRIPIAVAETSALLPPPFATTPIVLVADRAGTIVHASVAGPFTDWICGIARVVAAGTKPRAEVARAPSATEQADRREICSRQLAALVDDFEKRVQGLRLRSALHSNAASGSCFWAASAVEGDARPLCCPSDPSATPVSVYADHYLTDGVCSYVGPDLVTRDLRKEADDAVVGACLHHPGGVLVARANGKVEFLTLKDLGIASEAEKVVGPESKSPILRLLRP